jgi:CheY-like chemotaxis protein
MLDAPTAGRSAAEPVDVGALARETATLLGPAIPAHVRVEFDEEPALPRVQGNPTHLRQIVMNLLLNASEAIGERHGRVHVRLGRTGIAGGANGHAARLVLTVSDTGIGMTPATQARIFEPAFTTKARGRGIGLAIVRKLVEAHGATITVESSPRTGTRFTVSFPTADRIAPTPRVPAHAPRLGPPLRALLVDDDEGVRLTTAHMLRRLGCEVITAADGAAALAVLETSATSLDLVLLDMAMPGMSGEDLAATMRERWPVLPIVVMSGYATQDLTRRLGQHPILRFLQKPFGLEALRGCLADLDAAGPQMTAPDKSTRAAQA